jgi:hypothetical protein
VGSVFSFWSPGLFTTKGSEDEALQLDDELVFYQQVHAFVLDQLRMLQFEPNFILRVIRSQPIGPRV